MSSTHWLTKELTLDLLAIGIHSLQKVYDAVKDAPAPGTDWPQETPQVEPAPAETPAPQPTPETAPAEVPAAEPELDLRPDAQTELRHISQGCLLYTSDAADE